MKNPRFLLTGDSSFTIEFGNEISPQINNDIRALNIAISEANIKGLVETVPTYRSLMVHYKPEIIGYDELVDKLKAILNNIDNITLSPPTVIEIPVLYGGEVGEDLEFVSAHCNKTIDEVIKIHTSKNYLIYMLGFTPGFPYLGGMDKSIATPRLSSPRVKIEAGSVGIAGEQTGIYPLASPGGWQIIGRTPLKLYDPNRDKPILLQAGQYIKFKSIDKSEYDKITSQINTNTYTYNIYSMEADNGN